MTDETLTCRELAGLVTDYFELSLSDLDRARFEAHLRSCANCTTYLEQMRQTVRLTGALPPAEVDPAVRDELLRLFKEWQHSRGGQG